MRGESIVAFITQHLSRMEALSTVSISVAINHRISQPIGRSLLQINVDVDDECTGEQIATLSVPGSSLLSFFLSFFFLLCR